MSKIVIGILTDYHESTKVQKHDIYFLCLSHFSVLQNAHNE